MQVFATRAHLAAFGLPTAWLGAVTDEDQDAALAATSALAAGYLATQYAPPLVAWGDDLRRAVCHLAAWDLLCRRGCNPDAPAEAAVKQRAEDALRWLREVAAGRVAPPDLIDSTPAVEEGGSYVASDLPRTW
jgi:phage gp36-like protein